jgi:hypothetical protein
MSKKKEHQTGTDLSLCNNSFCDEGIFFKTAYICIRRKKKHLKNEETSKTIKKKKKQIRKYEMIRAVGK